MGVMKRLHTKRQQGEYMRRDELRFAAPWLIDVAGRAHGKDPAAPEKEGDGAEAIRSWFEPG